MNYIPIPADMSDLIEKIQWLRTNPGFAKAVGEAGRQLALTMTYEREICRSIHMAGCEFQRRKLPQIDQGVGHQFHTVVALLFELEA